MSEMDEQTDKRRTRRAKELGCACRWEDGFLTTCDAERHPWRALPPDWDQEPGMRTFKKEFAPMSRNPSWGRDPTVRPKKRGEPGGDNG